MPLPLPLPLLQCAPWTIARRQWTRASKSRRERPLINALVFPTKTRTLLAPRSVLGHATGRQTLRQLSMLSHSRTHTCAGCLCVRACAWAAAALLAMAAFACQRVRPAYRARFVRVFCRQLRTGFGQSQNSWENPCLKFWNNFATVENALNLKSNNPLVMQTFHSIATTIQTRIVAIFSVSCGVFQFE